MCVCVCQRESYISLFKSYTYLYIEYSNNLNNLDINNQFIYIMTERYIDASLARSSVGVLRLNSATIKYRTKTPPVGACVYRCVCVCVCVSACVCRCDWPPSAQERGLYKVHRGLCYLCLL